MYARRMVPVILCTALASCATRSGPGVVSVAAGDYARAFDAAMASAADAGMRPALIDRRSGVIETDPANSGSVVEPWRPLSGSARDGLENTIAFNRRAARLEFRPTEVKGASEGDRSDLRGPDLLSLPTLGGDLTSWSGPLELRAWVYVHRRQTRGMRHGTWSRRSGSVTKILPADAKWEQAPSWFWQPIARDRIAEQRLLADIARRLEP